MVVSVDDHPFFERDGDDLWCQIPVSFPTLALGGTIRVPTLEGEETVTIPKGTQPDAKFRVRGEGMPRLSGRGRGDIYVTVQVAVPTSLTQDQTTLIEKLDATIPQKSSAPQSRAGAATSDERPSSSASGTSLASRLW